MCIVELICGGCFIRQVRKYGEYPNWLCPTSFAGMEELGQCCQHILIAFPFEILGKLEMETQIKNMTGVFLKKGLKAL